MKALGGKISSIVISLFELLVGILLLINPIGFTEGIIITFGAVLVILALVSLVGYFRKNPKEAALEHGLFNGLLCLITGLFCIFKSYWFVVTFPLFTIIYGIIILIIGLLKVEATVDIIRTKAGKWGISAIGAAISVLCAWVILSNPFATTTVLWMFTGASFIVDAIFDAVCVLFGGKIHE